MESVANAHPIFLFELPVAHLIDLQLKAERGVSCRLGCVSYNILRRAKTLHKKRHRMQFFALKIKEEEFNSHFQGRLRIFHLKRFRMCTPEVNIC